MSLTESIDTAAVLDRLLAYAASKDYAGYDPYDTLKSYLPFHLLGKWGPVIAIQIQKRNPLNLRPLLGIREERNPKAIGLFLRAYSILYRQRPVPEYLDVMQSLYRWLKEHPSAGYSRYCWGYNFPWASPVKYLPSYMPSVVATGFVVKGLYEYWRAVSDTEVLPLLCGAADFVLHHIERYEDESGISFSYTPVMKDVCYNASLLAAEILAKYLAVKHASSAEAIADSAVQTLPSDDEVLALIQKAVDFVIAKQKADGSWNYSMDIATGTERQQIDFHQGYIIESIEEIMRANGERPASWDAAIQRGLTYYRHRQFLDDGRSLWRLPKQWPVEIHNQAQGIVTFSRYSAYREFASVITDWTIRNMLHPAGYFYYQKLSHYSIRIPYMRWSQAWMAVALTLTPPQQERSRVRPHLSSSRLREKHH